MYPCPVLLIVLDIGEGHKDIFDAAPAESICFNRGRRFTFKGDTRQSGVVSKGIAVDFGHAIWDEKIFEVCTIESIFTNGGYNSGDVAPLKVVAIAESIVADGGQISIIIIICKG